MFIVLYRWQLEPEKEQLFMEGWSELVHRNVEQMGALGRREGIAALEELGVTDVIIGFRNVYEMEPDKPLDEKIAMLNWYAGEFIRP